MGITLAVIHNIGDLETEEATFCSQEETPEEWQRYQPTQKTSNPNLLLSTRNSGTRDRAKSEGIFKQ